MSAYLYLVRHPHTHLDLSAPAEAWGLSDQGRAQTAALAEAAFWRGVTALYPSAERKAIWPAEQVAARWGMPVAPMPAFNEVDRRAYTAPDQASYTAAVAALLAWPEAGPQPRAPIRPLPPRRRRPPRRCSNRCETSRCVPGQTRSIPC